MFFPGFNYSYQPDTQAAGFNVNYCKPLQLRFPSKSLHAWPHWRHALPPVMAAISYSRPSFGSVSSKSSPVLPFPLLQALPTPWIKQHCLSFCFTPFHSETQSPYGESPPCCLCRLYFCLLHTRFVVPLCFYSLCCARLARVLQVQAHARLCLGIWASPQAGEEGPCLAAMLL